MRFKIYRFNEEKAWFDTFEITPKPHTSVLEALFMIQDEQDSSLSFRYSCRGAVCGSCAMLINKKQRLACRTQVSEIIGETVVGISPYGPLAKPVLKAGREILVEPLPNLPVLKDLIVDMKMFFRHYEALKPGFNPDTHGLKETLMTQENVSEVDRYAACIMCGLCYGACPAAARNRDFLGPASLSNAWRFYRDIRHSDKDEILKSVDSVSGVWACDEVYRCVEVCPKQVPPTNAITGFMKEIILHKIKHIFRRT